MNDLKRLCGLGAYIGDEITKAHREESIKTSYHAGDKDYKRIIPSQYMSGSYGTGGDSFMTKVISK